MIKRCVKSGTLNSSNLKSGELISGFGEKNSVLDSECLLIWNFDKVDIERSLDHYVSLCVNFTFSLQCASVSWCYGGDRLIKSTIYCQ